MLWKSKSLRKYKALKLSLVNDYKYIYNLLDSQRYMTGFIRCFHQPHKLVAVMSGSIFFKQF